MRGQAGDACGIGTVGVQFPLGSCRPHPYPCAGDQCADGETGAAGDGDSHRPHWNLVAEQEVESDIGRNEFSRNDACRYACALPGRSPLFRAQRPDHRSRYQWADEGAQYRHRNEHERKRHVELRQLATSGFPYALMAY